MQSHYYFSAAELARIEEERQREAARLRVLSLARRLRQAARA